MLGEEKMVTYQCIKEERSSGIWLLNSAKLSVVPAGEKA